MLTARKLVSACATAAFAAGRWREWVTARDGLFLGSRTTSFRSACLGALREIGLGDVATELLSDEAETERVQGDGVRACVDDLP